MTAFVTSHFSLRHHHSLRHDSANALTQRRRRTRSHSTVVTSSTTLPRVTVLDYGAGNVRSLENAVRLFGFDIHWAQQPEDILNAEKLIFPGVGSFGAAMDNLHAHDFVGALREYIMADRPFLGICLGLQTLFSSSEESPGVRGLDLFSGVVRRFDISGSGLSVPHIGWNTVNARRPSVLLDGAPSAIDETSQRDKNDRFYFVHSYRVGMDIGNSLPGDVLGTTKHGEEYVSVLERGRVCATQFHPEKSGAAGLRLIRNFLTADSERGIVTVSMPSAAVAVARGSGAQAPTPTAGLAKRVVACLDVRENDDGDLVVTKGDQYDVREADSGGVRNLGKPVALAHRYFRDGADEIVFLNITSFRGEPVSSTPMLTVLQETSRRVFVPLCIGGGIRDYTDKKGVFYSALDVADTYFRAGADKVSIGSDAVYAAEKFWANGSRGDGTSSIERISHVYGAQAVVVSVDPRRVYIDDEEKCSYDTVTLPNGRRCWYQCTVKGGREGRDIDVVQLVKAVEALGAGEILLNSMDHDGQNNGYDIALVRLVKQNVSIPIIASSGAGKAEHFSECFDKTDVEAALAAGIFHRQEVHVEDVKSHLDSHGTPVRLGQQIDGLADNDFLAKEGDVQIRVGTAKR